jgi:putative transposase
LAVEGSIVNYNRGSKAGYNLHLESDFCIDALEEAIEKHGQPEIFNTDQGSQFTSKNFIHELAKREIKISMDGKGSVLDNVFIERFWRSLINLVQATLKKFNISASKYCLKFDNGVLKHYLFE